MATKKSKKGNAICEICGRDLEVKVQSESIYCFDCYTKYSNLQEKLKMEYDYENDTSEQ